MYLGGMSGSKPTGESAKYGYVKPVDRLNKISFPKRIIAHRWITLDIPGVKDDIKKVVEDVLARFATNPIDGKQHVIDEITKRVVEIIETSK